MLFLLSNKTNEKTFSFFYFHIDIKKYFVCCIKISCRFCFSLAATHVCNKTWNVFIEHFTFEKINGCLIFLFDKYWLLYNFIGNKISTQMWHIFHFSLKYVFCSWRHKHKGKVSFLFPSLVPEYYNSGFLGPRKVLIKTHGLQTRPRHSRLWKFNSVKNSLHRHKSKQHCCQQ